MENTSMNNAAREAILGSIRSNLARSVADDGNRVHRENPVILAKKAPRATLVNLFKDNLESVNGHCIIADSESEIARALTTIISNLHAQRIALSDTPSIERIMYMTDLEIEELAIAPSSSEIFSFDVGISTAQAAIADTGTLVLDSACERNRLVSLVPPVHIAIIDASCIVETLGEALTLLRKDNEISPAVTFITGPSRTADIELTLAIGVHGPQELFVIINLAADFLG
jgi:L-lactate dehydrogenase complex protein LldG